MSRRDFARMTPNQGNMHRPVITRDRSRVIPHAPKTVMATSQTLVSGEDDQGIVIKAILLKRLHHPANAIIHSAHLRRVPPDRDGIIDIVPIVK